jgi:hypothetical protein
MLPSILPGIVEYRLNHTDRHLEHICDLFGRDARVKITNDHVCRKPGMLKDGDSADLTGNALNQVAAVPINPYTLVKHGTQHGWDGRHHRFVETFRPAGDTQGIIAAVSNTDFLQAISLFHTRDRRRKAEAAGKQGKDLPAVSCNRQALLNLPFEEYKRYEAQVEKGFVQAAKFLHILHIYRIFDLPYQSQIVPLAAILADISDAWEHEANRSKLVTWYWNGVFGELYGSAVESRIARDFMEVPAWLGGGDKPSTVTETLFRADRLKTMRMRLSAAYKGVNALLMKSGAQDFRSGQEFNYAIFFGENVDIHHIFPQDWCKNHGIKPSIFDSIINKTPLSYRTNRMIGGIAPSAYIAKLEKGNASTPSIAKGRLDGYLSSHLIDPQLLRADSFDEFMVARQNRLLALIEQATGKAAYVGDVPEEGDEVEGEDATSIGLQATNGEAPPPM